MTLQVPNARERELWRRALRNYERLSRNVALCRMRLEYALIARAHASKHGVAVAVRSHGWYEQMISRLDYVEQLANKLAFVIAAAEQGELAARPTVGGDDLDIITPAPMHSKWKPFVLNAGDLPPEEELGIAPLILLGIIIAVVVGGIVTVTALSNNVAAKLEADIQEATLEAEEKFCEDPSSAICTAWLARKKQSDAKESRSAIDYLFGKGSGKKVAGGLGLALGVAGAFWLISKGLSS